MALQQVQGRGKGARGVGKGGWREKVLYRGCTVMADSPLGDSCGGCALHAVAWRASLPLPPALTRESGPTHNTC